MNAEQTRAKRMAQLHAFVKHEREHNPGNTHIAEWALNEIERLERELSSPSQSADPFGY